MTRFVTTALFSLTVATALLAVEVAPAAAQVGAGLKAGIVSSTFGTDPDVSDQLSNLTDVSAGAFVILNRSAPLTAQVEALVTRRGTSISSDIFDLLPGGLGIFDLVKVRGTYLDVSGFARAQFGQPQQFYLFVGPTVGVKLKAELTAVGLSQDIGPIAEDFDVAVAVGAGVDVSHLVLEARYTYGLTDLIPGVEVFNIQVRNRAFTVMAGMRF